MLNDTSVQNKDASQRRLANLRPFQPGVSGNPGGRPKADKDVKALALQNSVVAMQRIVDLIDDSDPRVAFMAAKEVLDRALGKVKAAEDDETDKKSLTINIVKYGDRDHTAEPVAAEAVSVRTLALS